jgi:hypothetical protein
MNLQPRVTAASAGRHEQAERRRHAVCSLSLRRSDIAAKLRVSQRHSRLAQRDRGSIGVLRRTPVPSERASISASAMHRKSAQLMAGRRRLACSAVRAGLLRIVGSEIRARQAECEAAKSDRARARRHEIAERTPRDCRFQWYLPFRRPGTSVRLGSRADDVDLDRTSSMASDRAMWPAFGLDVQRFTKRSS